MARKPVADSLLLSGAGSLVSGLAFLSAAYPMVRRAGSGPSRSANIAHAIWWAGLGAYLVLQAGMTMLASRGQLTADIYLGSRLVAIPLLCAAVWGLCSYFAYLLTGKRRTSLYFLALYVAVMVVFFATTFIDPPALVIGEWLVGYDASSPLVALVYVLVGLPPILACVAYIALLRRVHDAHRKHPPRPAGSDGCRIQREGPPAVPAHQCGGLADTTGSEIQALEAQWNIHPDTRVFLLVARMDPMKRHDLAIRAFARIHKEHPNSRLVLVGNGSFSGPLGGVTGKGKSAEWRERLKWVAAELGVTNAITFAHWIPDGLLAAAYARADAVLLTSDIEGFGLTPLEAWRYGRVPIISSGCGASEIITDGINGLVFESGKEDALVAAMRKVVTDQEAMTRIGEAGRLTLPKYTAAQANPAIREILDEAISGYGH